MVLAPLNEGICPACLSNRSKVFVEVPCDREYFISRTVATTVRRCSKCQSIFQNPWVDEAESRSFYPWGYQNYVSSDVPLIGILFLALQRRMARTFTARHGTQVRVLDFGCGPGFFLRSLAEQGSRNLTGFDFSEYERDTGRPFTFISDFEVLSTYRGSFDVIRMSHVIEHLTKVDDTMCFLRRLLTPNGIIVGQTPMADHYTADLFREYWGPLHYPFHTLIFSRGGLRTAAQRWGLQLKNIDAVMLPTGWAMSFENIAKGIMGSKRSGRSKSYLIWLLAGLPPAILDKLLRNSAIADFTLMST